jgi:hypothetical protein
MNCHVKLYKKFRGKINEKIDPRCTWQADEAEGEAGGDVLALEVEQEADEDVAGLTKK